MKTHETILGACAVVAVFASCRQIAGVSDVSLDGASAAATTGTNATSASATGSGGATSSGGTQASSSATGGAGGSGGDGGASCANTDSDPLNCGGCGHSCQGGPCEQGKCRAWPLFENAEGGVWAIAVDDQPDGSVYWTDNYHVHKTSKRGGSDDWLTDAGPGVPKGIAIDATYVYFSLEQWQVPLYVARVAQTGNGQPPDKLAQGWLGAWSVAVDAQNVYWTSRFDSRIVARAPIGAAGDPITLFSSLSTDEAYALAIDDTHVYFTVDGASGSGGLYRTPKGGGGPVDQLAVAPGGPNGGGSRGVVVDDSFVYWFDAFDATLRRIAKDGSGPITALAVGSWSPWMAQDSTYVYWPAGLSPNGSIRRVRKDNSDGAAQILVEGLPEPQGIAVDATSVYWCSYGDNSVMRLALPISNGG